MSIYQPEQKQGDDFVISRLKKNGKNYEIIIDSEEALKVRKGEASVEDALLVQKIFKDARKGDVQGDLKEAFGTNDVLAIAKEIILNGDVPITQEYRDKIIEQKKNQVLEALSKKAVDPETHYPIPRQRVELAIEKIGYKISFEKSVKEQVKELTDKLPEAMPVTFKDIKVMITSPPQFSGQTFNVVKKTGEVISQEYQPDGSLIIKLEMPAGRKKELIDKLKGISHGLIKIKEE
ncbi:ribosome assembly factor SBDS [archaeon]|nr:ribosome assembly factor SBDS [archaeon]